MNLRKLFAKGAILLEAPSWELTIAIHFNISDTESNHATKPSLYMT